MKSKYKIGIGILILLLVGIFSFTSLDNESTEKVFMGDTGVASDIEFDPRTPENDTWITEDNFRAYVDISNCTNFSNVTYKLRGEPFSNE